MGGVQVGWGRGLGNGEMCVQSIGEMRKDDGKNVLQPFHGNIDIRSCNDGSRELITVFHNPHLSFDGGSQWWSNGRGEEVPGVGPKPTLKISNMIAKPPRN